MWSVLVRRLPQKFYGFHSGLRNPEDGHLLQWPIETDGDGKFGFVTDFIADFPAADFPAAGSSQKWMWQGTANTISQMPLISKVPESRSYCP
ncbi:MAG: hypothetical protein ACI9G1_001044 [Pirellulaceae bacterium]